MEKDSELSTVKSEREKLEKEMQAMLQQEKEAIKSKGKGKGPGGMLHSALQQLQRELRREAVANEKLMVKAESLLKDGSMPVTGMAESTPQPTAAASTADNEEQASDKDEKEKDDEGQTDEEGSEEQASEEPVRCVLCPPEDGFLLFCLTALGM